MGSSVSKAEREREEAEQQITQMLQVLENKRDEFLAQVKLTRGEGTDTSKEVQGGRTITRVSDIRVATSAGPSDQLKEGLNTFFEVVQGGDRAKAAAVEGAQQLLSTGLDAIFGARAGQGKQKVGFVILFVNYAFVRVDYLVYAYTASGSKWGAKSSVSGACYVADLAVLPLEALKSTEIDYLLAQSLTLPAESSDEEFQAIQRLKIQLVQSKVLSALLEQDGLTLEDLANYAEALVATEKAIREAFNSLKDFGGDFVPPSAGTNTTNGEILAGTTNGEFPAGTTNPVSTITGTTSPVILSAPDTTDDL